MKKRSKYKEPIVIPATFTELVKMSVADNPKPKQKGLPYDIQEEFKMVFVYQETLYEADVKVIKYSKEEINYYRVEYESSGNKGVISKLYCTDPQKLIWDSKDFPDKELIQIVGNRIAMKYMGKNVLKIE